MVNKSLKNHPKLVITFPADEIEFAFVTYFCQVLTTVCVMVFSSIIHGHIDTESLADYA